MAELNFNYDPEDSSITALTAAALKNGREWGYWADQQLRDPGGERGGWFIEMGGLNLFNAVGKDGKVRGVRGKYVGPSPVGQGYGRFVVTGQDGVDDGVYHVNVANIDAVKGIISEEYLRSIGREIPIQKEGIVDLSKTRIDPITKQDLDDANIEPDKPKNLRKIAEGRAKSAKKFGDLSEGDIVFDEGNDRFGEVVSTVDKDGNFSPWFKWENNEISQTPGVAAEDETAVWPQPAEPIEDMATEKTGSAQVSDIVAGDIVLDKEGNSREVESVERERGLGFIVTYKSQKGLRERDTYDRGEKVSYAKAKPAAEKTADKAKAKPNKTTGSALKKNDKITYDGRPHTVEAVSKPNEIGERNVTLVDDNGEKVKITVAGDDSFDVVPESAKSEEKAKPAAPSNVVVGYVEELKRGQVVKAANGEELIFVSAEKVDPKTYSAVFQRENGEQATLRVPAEQKLLTLVELDAAGKRTKKQVNRADKLPKEEKPAAAPAAPAEPKPAKAPAAPKPAAPSEAPTSVEPGKKGKISGKVVYEVLEDGRILVTNFESGQPKIKTLREIIAKINRSGAAQLSIKFNNPEDERGDSSIGMGWVVGIDPINKTVEEVGLDLLQQFHGEVNRPVSEVTEEAAETISGAKSTKGQLANDLSFEINDKGRITIAGDIEGNMLAIQSVLFEESGAVPETDFDIDENTGNLIVRVLNNTDENRAAILSIINSALKETAPSEPAEPTPEPEAEPEAEPTAEPEEAEPAVEEEPTDLDKLSDEVGRLMAIPGVLEPQDKTALNALLTNVNKNSLTSAINYLRKKMETKGIKDPLTEEPTAEPEPEVVAEPTPEPTPEPEPEPEVEDVVGITRQTLNKKIETLEKLIQDGQELIDSAKAAKQPVDQGLIDSVNQYKRQLQGHQFAQRMARMLNRDRVNLPRSVLDGVQRPPSEGQVNSIFRRLNEEGVVTPDRAKEIKDQLLSSKIDQDSLSDLIDELDRAQLRKRMANGESVEDLRVLPDMVEEVREYLKGRAAAKPEEPTVEPEAEPTAEPEKTALAPELDTPFVRAKMTDKQIEYVNSRWDTLSDSVKQKLADILAKADPKVSKYLYSTDKAIKDLLFNSIKLTEWVRKMEAGLPIEYNHWEDKIDRSRLYPMYDVDAVFGIDYTKIQKLISDYTESGNSPLTKQQIFAALKPDQAAEPKPEPTPEPEPTVEPKPEAPAKPEYFDPATNFMTVDQNNNAYWEWAKESLKNGTMSPEDKAELVERLQNAVLSSTIAAEALDPSGSNVRGNLLKSNILSALKDNPDITLEEALSKSGAYGLQSDKDFNAWRRLLGDDTFVSLRDDLEAQLVNLATEYYNEAKQDQVGEPAVEEPAAEPTPEPAPAVEPVVEEPVVEPTPVPTPVAEALPENTTPKKASEVKFGDRVFDNTTKSFATVVGIREAANRPNRTIITLRFDDGTERSAIYKNSVVFLVESKPESEKPAATQPDPTPVDQDPQDAVEQGDSVPAEPGSVVVDETPEEPAPSKPAVRKPKKFDLRGVPEEERAAVIELWDAVESFAKAVARVGNQTFVPPERSISKEDRQKYGVLQGDVSAEITKSIEQALGVTLVEPTTDAIDPETGYTKRQPTPGAFTGLVAKLVEGKTKKETRDIIKGLPVFWFDTETTGISSFDGDPTNNDAVQVGIVFTENGEVKRRLNIYLNPGIENGVRLGKWSAQNLKRDVLDKDGNPVLDADGKPKTELVTNEWLSEQMSISDAVAKIIEFMGPNPIIGGQNVPFDLQVLNRMLAVSRRTDFSIAGTVDSKDLAEALLPKYNKKTGVDGPKKYDKERKDFIPTSSLGFVAEFLGFDLTRWHSADGDAEDSWKLTSSILDRAAAEDPDGTSDLMNKEFMAQRYAQRMEEFLATIDANNPSTAKQHGAVRKDGFAEYLDDLGVNPVAQVTILNQLKAMTRGEAANFIRVFIQANPLPKPTVSRRELNLTDVTKAIESLEAKKRAPLPASLVNLPPVGEDPDKIAIKYRAKFADYLKALYPSENTSDIISKLSKNPSLFAKESATFDAWFQANEKPISYQRIQVGNAVLKFEKDSIPTGSLSVLTNGLDYLQKNYPMGGLPIEIEIYSQKDLDEKAGKADTSGVAWTDAAGGHIILSASTIGRVEADPRTGRKGFVAADLATLIHEYGHIYHEAVMGTNFTKNEDMDLAAEFYKKFKNTFVTPYGETDHVEKFSELFYDLIYSRMDNEDPAVPEFATFFDAIANQRATLLSKFAVTSFFGKKRVSRRESIPENTSFEFNGATEVTGEALARIEQVKYLGGTWIPDENDEEQYQDYKSRVKFAGIDDDKFYRELFSSDIAKAKADTRRFRVFRVEGTNSFVRFKAGDATPQAIQATIDQITRLERFNNVKGVTKYITLTKKGDFGLRRLFAGTAGSTLHGYHFTANGASYITADPAGLTEPVRVRGPWFDSGQPDASNMLARTLVHEYGHLWAKFVLGSNASDPRYADFIAQFREVGPGHPISELGTSFGESIAEYFNAAYWKFSPETEEGQRGLPEKGTPLRRFVEFFGKYFSEDTVLSIAPNPIADIEDFSSSKPLKFPTVLKDATPENLMLEFADRREFYRNGLSPYGVPVSLKHADIMKRYLALLEEQQVLQQSSASESDYNNLVAGVAALKKFYDGLFFSYAKKNSRFSAEDILDKISTDESRFRSRSSSTPLVNVPSQGPFQNVSVPGTYQDRSGVKYPLVYFSTTAADGTEAAVAVAVDPKFANRDLANMSLADLMDFAIGMVIAKGSSDKTDMTVSGATVSNSRRRRGIATALLGMLRQNNKKNVLHSKYADRELAAWAQSVDSNPENYVSPIPAFKDTYGTAKQDRNSTNIQTKAPEAKEEKVSDEVLDADSIHYAGGAYGEVYHPDIADYVSDHGGGLGFAKSTVGYVSTRLLSQMKGNEPSDLASVERKLENLLDGDGFDEPVIVAYNAKTKEAYVADGNHRVQASLEAGRSHVPARVVIVDGPTLQKGATPIKLERDGGLPMPESATEVHPYFVFNRKDLVTPENQSTEESIEDMLTNLALWTSKESKETTNRAAFLPNPDSPLEKAAPGEFVKDKATGKIYKVINLEAVKRVDDNGQEISEKTGRIVVRHLDGIADQMEIAPDETTPFNASDVRRAVVGDYSANENYNDIRIYTDEVRNPEDFVNVTETFMKLSDQPILIDDTMYVVQRETGLRGRISGFPEEGKVRLDVLKGYDEDQEPVYDQIIALVTEILPIQNQREYLDGEDPTEQAADMTPTRSQKEKINTLSARLLKFGYLSDEKYAAIQLSTHANFITRSGAQDVLLRLEDLNLLRLLKVRGMKPEAARVEVLPERKPVQQAPATPAPKQGEMRFEDLLRFRNEREITDRDSEIEDLASPITKSKVKTNQPRLADLLEAERLISEPGVLSNERALEILSSLPLLNAKSLDGVLDELRTAALDKRIANDESVSGIVIPESYNDTKLMGYVPRKDKNGDEIIEDMSGFRETLGEQKTPEVKLSAEQKAALDHVLQAKKGVTFLTGNAGTGKSTLVREIERQASGRGKSIGIVAPTGIAALNVGAETINTMFMFPTTYLGEIDMVEHAAKISKKKLAALKGMNLLIVDEISMVNADTVDAMDRLLRVVRNNMGEAFGGLQILMVGDPYQLPPVPFRADRDPEAAKYMMENYISNWFFHADVWSANPFEQISLTEIFRQSDKADQELLNRARTGTITPEDLNALNSRIAANTKKNPVVEGVTLVPTRDQAAAINKREMDALKSAPVTFVGKYEGPDAEKLFSEGVYPDENSVFKVGQKVMFVKNDDKDMRRAAGVDSSEMDTQRWVNGTSGVVVGFDTVTSEDERGTVQEKYSAVLVEVTDEKTGEVKEYKVTPAKWSSVEFVGETMIEEGRRQKEVVIKKEESASYTQIPLVSGWARTIHKSQGQTYDSATIDYKPISASDKGRPIGRAFAAGQTYVALSRLKSLDNLRAASPFVLQDFIVDPNVRRFMGQDRKDPIAGRVESMLTKDFDPLKGFESAAEIENALMQEKITGPNGETLTTYQRNALLGYLQKIKSNPESADRLREKMLSLLRSWFATGESVEDMSTIKPVEVNVNNFRDPAEKQALLDLLSSNGIPYNLKYDS